MKLFNNAAVYVISYLVLMVPTYILPYFGSNSALIGAASAAAGVGSYPLFWLHAMFLFALCVIAWARGGCVKKNWLAVLPGLATFFDLMPGFSWIPLLPTGLHVAAIITGAVSKPSSQGESPVPSVPLVRDAKFWTLAAGCGILFFLFLSGVQRIEDRSSKTMADLAKGVPLYRAGRDDGSPKPSASAAPAPRASSTPHALSSLQPLQTESVRPPDARLLALVSTDNYLDGVFQQGAAEFRFRIRFRDVEPTSGQFRAVIEYPSLGGGTKELAGRVTENRLDMTDVRYISQAGLGFLNVRYILEMQAPAQLTGRWHHPTHGSGNFWIDVPHGNQQSAASEAVTQPTQSKQEQRAPSLRSLPSQQPTSIRFLNSSDQPVKVLWKDFSGGEKLYMTLAPGYSYEQPTYIGHAWVVKESAADAIVLTIVATEKQQVARIGRP